MKCDGHAKITNEAIKQLLSQCGSDAIKKQNLCKLKDFNTIKHDWKDKFSSNETDNYKIAQSVAISLLTPNIPALYDFKGYLTSRVIAIDLDFKYLLKHYSSAGQKYHFMRDPNEDLTVSYSNGCNFIYENANKWIQITNRILHNKMTVINNRLRENSLEHLALALHCLQDTFSPGHTTRAHSSTIHQPGNITDIHIYNEHNKITHSKHDYASGSTKSILAKMSISASTELMSICLDAVANGHDRLHSWPKFKNTWVNLGK